MSYLGNEKHQLKIDLCRSPKTLKPMVIGELKRAVLVGEIPDVKYTVSVKWAGSTPSVTAKAYMPPPEDRAERRALENRIEHVIRAFNWDESRIEMDHFDVGYYTHVQFINKEVAK